ncbi:uncharacterized protein NECHADRAFT_48248 [Fusarium vanettenii 77-13-4]|uniref:DUF1989 domain-containing protein n=1 Tax=Fusarium vanettenii (strain ATCC MYA-4622 / CBS 123669 / FGSC 9596 / NRRL 45880 / 77-13-4) TaxID=660122 RepID=C7ZD23_FUSV7|nr:uncharacterized protein NECHADRAFT_48248 [Fusarium vanettenii 77-13-4]EEU38143.1 hypothetical protein NECHADRAFT_48248 [Fusarium vanettenii 77-13-4]
MATQNGKPSNPTPSYVASEGSVLYANRVLYTRIAETTARKIVQDFIVPIRSGRAWCVPAGHICRISTPEGPQVGDLNIWNLQNPREKFWASRTKQLHAAHVSTFDRLWSCLPFLRPMVTIIGDSLGGDKYGTDAVGGRVHDLLGTRCDPYVNKMLTGHDFDYHCHSNLTRAIMPWGLTEYDVHDVINLFQVTGLNRDDKYFMRPCPAKPGDYIEFFAEIDVLMGLSTCPGGDLSAWSFGGGADDMLATCRPLRVEVWEITDQTVLKDWESSEPPAYKGLHGIELS